MRLRFETYTELDPVVNVVAELWPGHYDESARNKALLKLNPDYDQYRAMAAAGKLFVVCAFGPSSKQAIGYSCNFAPVPHPHYADTILCYNDLLFVNPYWRTTLAGGRLMVMTRQEAKRRGCAAVSWHAKPNTVLDRMLATRMPVNEHMYLDKL